MKGLSSARANLGGEQEHNDYMSTSSPSVGRAWAAASLLLVAAVLAGSVLAGVAWDRSVAQANRHAFDGEASGIASSIATSLKRLSDLTFSASAHFQSTPQMTAQQFTAWAQATDVARRYPGIVQFGGIRVVTRAQLPAFLARLQAAQPTGKQPTAASLGVHPAYCLAIGGLQVGSSSPMLTTFSGIDLCNSPMRAMLDATRDSGQPQVFAFTDPSDGRSLFSVLQPVYRSATPATVAGRRHALVGWMGGAFDAGAILSSAVSSHRNLMVKLSRSGAVTAAAMLSSAIHLGNSTGNADALLGVVGAVAHPKNKAVFPIQADGTWTVTIADAAGSKMTPLTQGLVIGVIGGVVALLLLMLSWVLGRGRDRARAIVRAQTEELRYQALHDPLTGLPNRTLIGDRAEMLLARGRREGTASAALFVDLDGFKSVNDTLGHAAGDELLVAVADRLRAVMRDTDTVGRMGGDEFVVLTEGEATPGVVAGRILDVLRQPFDLGASGTFTISASIGIAIGDRPDAGELLRAADIALYRAKSTGKDRYVVFTEDMQNSVQNRVDVERDMAGAIEREEMFLVYQPTVDLQSGSITSVEALLRWRHPVNGVLSPDRFIPVAEDTGLIVPIGRWVLDEACQQCAEWNADGIPISVSVNVSARQLESESFVDDIQAALGLSGLEPDKLFLEVTETTLMRDPLLAASLLRRIKELGVHIAIDDFGTGYSSFAYLREFPVDALKIDRTFVSTLTKPGQAQALVRSLVELGKTLNMRTVAEGIEETAQLEGLLSLGCDSGQGYLFGRPASREDVTRTLRAEYLPLTWSSLTGSMDV